MTKKLSKYENWLMETFKGSNPKESVLNKIYELLEKANQNSLPIRLSSVAIQIGIDPHPIFDENQKFDGCLVSYNNKLRISLKESDPKLINSRNRFTYAHELIHCLGYHFDANVSERVAPSPKLYNELKIEEEICNYGAAQLLLPFHILQNEYKKLEINKLNTTPDILNEISKLAKVNILVTIIQFFKLEQLFKKDTLVIVSQNDRGTGNKGEIKPRGKFSKYINNEGVSSAFLKPNQGLQHIKNVNGESTLWSLLNFYEYNSIYLEVKDEFIFNENTKRNYCISGFHKKMNSIYVWSELSIQPV
jgi:Zn-dependent peptidase ImmA (M78 family)